MYRNVEVREVSINESKGPRLSVAPWHVILYSKQEEEENRNIRPPEVFGYHETGFEGSRVTHGGRIMIK
jgi:hypothetical protein